MSVRQFMPRPFFAGATPVSQDAPLDLSPGATLPGEAARQLPEQRAYPRPAELPDPLPTALARLTPAQRQHAELCLHILEQADALRARALADLREIVGQIGEAL
jgi:hypothetical protein